MLTIPSAFAKQGNSVAHKHGARSHTHPLPSAGVNHSHGGQKHAKPRGSAVPATKYKKRVVNKTGYCKARIGDRVSPASFRSLYSKFDKGSNPGVKSEFETEAQYQSRIRATGIPSYLVAGSQLENIKYDAKRQAYLLSDVSVKNYDSLVSHHYITIFHKEIKTGRYKTSSLLMGTRTRNTTKSTIYYLMGDFKAKNNRKHRGGGDRNHVYYTMFKMDTGDDYYKDRIVVPMSPHVAKINKGKLKTAFVITPKKKLPIHSHNKKMVKESDIYVIYANVHCALILDKDNRVVKVAQASSYRKSNKKLEYKARPIKPKPKSVRDYDAEIKRRQEIIRKLREQIKATKR